MKKLDVLYTIIIVSLLSFSCTTDSPVIEPEKEIENNPTFNFNSMKNGEKLPVYYSEDNGKTFISNYNAVKIGEYLWMNSNFTTSVETEHQMTQHQINFGLDVYRIDTTQYSLTPHDVDKYIGQYYSLDKISRMNAIGNMYEGNDRIARGKWGLPSKDDFRQLFAMCGDGQEYDVRRHLTYKIGDIPIIKKTNNIYWITEANTNKYGFNLIYAGERAHSDGFNWGTCHDYPNECFNYIGKRGDFIIFYATAVFPTNDLTTVMLHDYPDTGKGKEWAWKTMRWTRKLSDNELGYKLYVNADRSDIIKLNLDETPPTGYAELPNGYLRGFYVQYILNNPNPTKTVSDLRQMELSLPEIVHGTVKPT